MEKPTRELTLLENSRKRIEAQRLEEERTHEVPRCSDGCPKRTKVSVRDEDGHETFRYKACDVCGAMFDVLLKRSKPAH